MHLLPPVPLKDSRPLRSSTKYTIRQKKYSPAHSSGFFFNSLCSKRPPCSSIPSNSPFFSPLLPFFSSSSPTGTGGFCCLQQAVSFTCSLSRSIYSFSFSPLL